MILWVNFLMNRRMLHAMPFIVGEIWLMFTSRNIAATYRSFRVRYLVLPCDVSYKQNNGANERDAMSLEEGSPLSTDTLRLDVTCGAVGSHIVGIWTVFAGVGTLPQGSTGTLPLKEPSVSSRILSFSCFCFFSPIYFFLHVFVGIARAVCAPQFAVVALSPSRVRSEPLPASTNYKIAR